MHVPLPPSTQGEHLPKSATGFMFYSFLGGAGRGPASPAHPASPSAVANEITSFSRIYLNQPFMSDGFKNMLEVSFLNTRNTNSRVRLHFPSSEAHPHPLSSFPLLPLPEQFSFMRPISVPSLRSVALKSAAWRVAVCPRVWVSSSMHRR